MNLLITDHTQNASSLIDRLNQNQVIKGIDVKSVDDIAKEIVLHDLAENGVIRSFHEPGRYACAFLIQTIMQDLHEQGELTYFITAKGKVISDPDTCAEIYAKLNEIRLGKATEAFQNTKDPKIMDLKKILRRFEKKLKEENYYDSARFLLEAEDPEKIDSWKKDNPDVTIWKHVFNEKLPDQKKLFLKRLKADDFDAWCRENHGHGIAYLSKGKPVITCAKAYGISNEVSDIVSEIEKEKIPYGDVTVYYPSQDYETYLDAEFVSRNVPLTFASGRNPGASQYFRMTRAILKWAENGFFYDDLRPVFSCGILKHDKDHSHPGNMYEKEVESGIGFGLERYAEYGGNIENLLNQAEQECQKDPSSEEKQNNLKQLQKKKNFAEFLDGLAHIFTGNPDSAVIYTRLLQWLDAFTVRSSGDKERTIYLSLLKDQKPEMNLIHIRDLKESCDFLLDAVDHLRLSDGDRPDAVRAIRMGDPYLENRKHVWFIGLSVNETEQAETESPVLTDQELETYICHPVHKASEAAHDLRDSLEETLKSVKGNVSLTYTYYDTNALLEWNPSSFYDDHKNEKEGTIAPENHFSAPVQFDYPLKTYDPDPQVLKEYLEKKNDEGKLIRSFSPTSTEVLLTCERKFYYQYILEINMPEETKLNYDVWLTGKRKGNLFHHVLKNYADAYLIDSDQDQLNMDGLKQIFDDEVEVQLAECPYMNEKIFEKEKEEDLENLRICLERMYEDIRNGWKVKGAEVSFKNPPVAFFEEEYPLVRFNGELDRYDVRTDENGHSIYRIVDYKTGRRESLEKTIGIDPKTGKKDPEKEKRIQHWVYMELLRRSLNDPDAQFTFSYDLICDDPHNRKPIQYAYDEKPGIIRAKVAIIQNKIDSFTGEMTKNKEDCRYCPYRTVCHREEGK